MIRTLSYAVQNSDSPLAPFSFERRDPGPKDVLIEILYCGICHSDIHQARNEWNNAVYPMVPGHEIVGRVSKVGEKVSKFKAGDLVGVGCMVDSCRTCPNCKDGDEQLCDNHISFTYNGTEQDKITVTQGGYSSNIVVSEDFTLKVSEKLNLAAVAPLLCAGITTYSPLKRAKIGKGYKVGIVGLGGLGHMGVKFAAAFGADVTVISTSPSKEKDAIKLGAKSFLVSKDEAAMQAQANKFDYILDTVAAEHNIDAILALLKRDGELTLVGVPEKPLSINAFSIIVKRRSVKGSLIGGIRETQEMLDYCAEKNIISDIEMIPVQKINEAFERTLKSDVRYRFVIDMKSLSQ